MSAQRGIVIPAKDMIAFLPPDVHYRERHRDAHRKYQNTDDSRNGYRKPEAVCGRTYVLKNDTFPRKNDKRYNVQTFELRFTCARHGKTDNEAVDRGDYQKIREALFTPAECRYRYRYNIIDKCSCRSTE